MSTVNKHENGEIIEDEQGYLIYRENGEPIHAGVVCVDGKIYYAGHDGVLVCGHHKDVHRDMANGLLKRGIYKFDENGVLVEGSYQKPEHRRSKKRAKLTKKQQQLVIGGILLGILILAISSFAGAKSLWNTVLGGTSVIIAVLTFAAQDVIKDVLAGIMISIYKPFDIGSRIELEDGTYGIVEDINLRHTVLVTVDTVRAVVPNSKINSMKIINCSYGLEETRAVIMTYSIAYDSDVDLAKKLIMQVIEESPLTVPGRVDKEGNNYYSPVYFMSFDSSALIMYVTVYYKWGTPTERVKDYLNCAVNEAFKKNNIEIPYNYINVIQK